jgi:hypothetical protein
MEPPQQQPDDAEAAPAAPASPAAQSPSAEGAAEAAVDAVEGTAAPGSPARGPEADAAADGWAGEGRTGGWASPQRRTESWMSDLERSQAGEDSGAWGDISSVVESEKPSMRRKSTDSASGGGGGVRPDSRGSVFSAESMSEQSLAVQRSTQSASWVEYCAALIRTGHCKHAAIGGVDGEVWATSPRFKKLSSLELVGIAKVKMREMENRVALFFFSSLLPLSIFLVFQFVVADDALPRQPQDTCKETT